MNKAEFLVALKKELSGIPKKEIEESINFYSEMIDDLVEDGKTEAEAVAELGDVNKIAAKILMETPIFELVKERVRPKNRLSGGKITVIAVTFPIWITLLAVAFAVAVSIFAVALSAFLSLWVIDLAFAVCAVAGAVGFIPMGFASGAPTALILLGVGAFSAGVAILLFFGCKEITFVMIKAGKALALWIKKCLRKGNHQ